MKNNCFVLIKKILKIKKQKIRQPFMNIKRRDEFYEKLGYYFLNIPGHAFV